MPAAVGYGSPVNLAAEVSKPPQQPTSVNDVESRKEDVGEGSETRELSAASLSRGGNTTQDRGQNLNTSA